VLTRHEGGIRERSKKKGIEGNLLKSGKGGGGETVVMPKKKTNTKQRGGHGGTTRSWGRGGPAKKTRKLSSNLKEKKKGANDCYSAGKNIARESKGENT